MIAFWLIAAAMIAAALAVALASLAQRSEPAAGRADSQDTAATLVAYRERLAELERDREGGQLTDADFAAARDELEHELLEQVPEAPQARSSRAQGHRGALAAAVVLIPAVTLAAYLLTGRPEVGATGQEERLTAAQAEQYARMPASERIRPLEAHVAEHPDAPRAWALLADAYRETERYGDAVSAFGRAREGGGTEDARLVARQAESLLLANGRRFTSSVQRLVDEALEVDPRNPLGLMLAGHAALTRGEGDAAAGYWQRLAEQIPANDPRREMVEQLIARAEGRTPDAGGASTSPATAGEGPAMRVRVELAESLRAGVDADDTVFVFARDADAGNTPPLAVSRTRVAELPASLELTDDQAMMADASLSSAERVVITARVSRTGDVAARSGDLEGSTAPLATDRDETITLTIDRRID